MRIVCGSCNQGMQAHVPTSEPQCQITCVHCRKVITFANPRYQPGQAASAPSDGMMQAKCGSCQTQVKVRTTPGHATMQFSCPTCNTLNKFDNPSAGAPASGSGGGHLKVQCGSCSQPFQAALPPGGGRCRARCPYCGQDNTVGGGAPAPPSGNPSAESDQSVLLTIQCGACSQHVRVNTAGTGGRCRFTCPCGQVNEFSIMGSEREQRAQRAIEVEYPPYWQTQSADASLFTYETQTMRAAMQRLLDETWKDQRTRDARILGRTGPMEKFQVVHVQRNENPKLWVPYYRLRTRLAEELRASGNCTQRPVKTSLEGCPVHARGKLLSDVNEFYLFHGTKPSAVKAICEDDFALNLSGVNAGTLYGPGLYFAEASTKADEYADDDKQGIFSGLYALILCRVMCGNIKYTDAVSPNTQDLVDSILTRHTHHSVLGDRERCRGTYREFIVFDQAQVYPEYVIIYQRVSHEE